MIAERRRYLRIFKKQNALSLESAIDPELYKLKKGIIFKNLVKQKILLQVANNNTYFLDENRERQIRKKAQKVAIIIMTIVAAFALISLAVIYLK